RRRAAASTCHCPLAEGAPTMRSSDEVATVVRMSEGRAGIGRSAPHVPFLDGWRGLAIASLLVGHFAPLPGVVNFGRMGVELFFVLSGRLMAEILFVRRFPIPAFFRRRIARVWPALFVFVIFIAVQAAILGASGTPRSLDDELHYLKAVTWFD